ncbi:MAG: hypothetical protein NTW94_07760 [Legionellales bacterium]|nr:hypothetical protein [Legionellales bacterium]
MSHMPPEMEVSFFGLQLLLDEGIVDKSEVDALVKRVYLPSLKILDYSLSEQGVTLYSHAPMPFSLIQELALQLEVPYDDATKESLAATIDHMNVRFGEIIKSNSWQALIDVEGTPLYQVVWNRWDDQQDTESARPRSIHGYGLTYVHGHDGYKSKLPQVINLDNLSGKGPRFTEALRMKKAKSDLEKPERREAAQKIIDDMRVSMITSDEYGLDFVLKPKKEEAPPPASKWSRLTNAISRTTSLSRGVAERLTHLFEGETPPDATKVKPNPSQENEWRHSYDKISKQLGGLGRSAKAVEPVDSVPKQAPDEPGSHHGVDQRINPTHKTK